MGSPRPSGASAATAGVATGTPPAASPAAGPPASDGRRAELVLLAFAAALTTGALVLVEANQEQRLSATVLYLGLAYLALFAAAHLAVWKLARYADPLILPCAALLNGLGLVMIHRVDLARADRAAQLGGPAPELFAGRQVAWTAIGLALFVGALWLVRDHRTLARYGYTFGLAGLMLIVLPGVLPSRISEVNGAKIWLRLSIFSIQPGEFAKVLLLVFFAALLTAKRELFTAAGRRVLGIEFPRPRDLGPLLVAWAASVGVLALENDLGSSLLFFGMLLVLLYTATERVSWLLLGMTFFGVGAVAAYYLFDHVQTRVRIWLDPLGDYNHAGFQLSQALFGLGTGGVAGTGLGVGRPELVPFAWSDFIVASLGEELGLVGLAAILMVYLLLVTRGLRGALAVRDSFGKLLAAGLAFALALQVFVVVGGVSRLIPLTGLAIPFLSAGGSALVANYVIVALLLRISHAARAPRVKRPEAAKVPLANARTELVAR